MKGTALFYSEEYVLFATSSIGFTPAVCQQNCRSPACEMSEFSGKRGHVLDNGSAAARRLSRREMIRRLVSGAGAGAVLAGTASAHPIYKHLADGTLLAGLDAHVPAGAWQPQYLNPHQSETLEVLAERILPNSSKAQVTRFIDLLLSVDTAEAQGALNHSLLAFDQEAQQRFGRPFKDASEANQDELLTVFSTPVPDSEKNRPEPSEDEPHPERLLAEGQATPFDHFQNIKTWVTGAYYSSEFGMRELGWNGVVFFQDFKGCQHPEGHA
jgi:Gluconate 2-dehydrogenase subunit 3